MPRRTLDSLSAGTAATVTEVAGDPTLQQRLLEMGVLPGVPLVVVRFAPLGDPMEIKVMGYSLSLRRSEARCVEVEVA
jgi:ferrous iron transport protein A